MEINKSHPVKQNVVFQGHQHKETDTGAQALHINAIYDRDKYDAEVHCYRVGMDKKNNFFIERGCDNSMEPFYRAELPKDGLMLEPAYDLDLEDDQPFAYKVALKDKNGNFVKYLEEDGPLYAGCVLVTRKGTNVIQQGPMYLGIPDTLNVGYVYAGFQDKDTGDVISPTPEQKKEIANKVRNTSRTFGTVAGGTMAGIEAAIPELAAAGNKRLITTPTQGGATMAADKYWAENNMLTAGGIGNRNNTLSMQRTAYRYGMNTVDDGTFTSEGLRGIHFQRAIKFMDNEDIPAEYYYFRMSGAKDGALTMGIVPENYQNFRLKLVNFPFDIVENKDGSYDTPENRDYDPERPMYIQAYDDSMVSDEQRNNKKEVFTSYAKTTPDGNKLAINTHDDTAIPYFFEVNNPNEVKKNIMNLNTVNKSGKGEKIKFNSPKGAMFVAEMSGIKIGPKTEGGFVCWGANTDIEKYNYFTSNYDTELLSEIKDPAERAIEMDKLRRGNCQIRDMATAVARYRTRSVRNNLEEYTARTLTTISSDPAKAYKRITDILNKQTPDKPVLPGDYSEKITKDVVTNVLAGDYEMRPKKENYHEAVIESLMSLPLDSIEFNPEVQGALSSPYLSKLSSDADHIGETRYDAMNDPSYKVPKEYAKTYNKVNEIFTDDIKSFADKVLQEVDKNSDEKLFTKDGQMTEYGKYLIPLVGQDIARYAVTKALMPTAKAKIMKNGEIAYDYDDMTKRGTLEHMNINGDSQKDEANQIANRLHNGVRRLMNDNVKFMADSINKRFENTNANSLKLAEVMVRRGGYGLDWRFDAAKDVSDYDSVRNGDQTMDTAWKNDVTFWGDMDRVIKEENNHSYTVAELTDVRALLEGTELEDRRNLIYDSEEKAVGVLLDLAGITSEANYSQFFDGITNMFGYSFTNGSNQVSKKGEEWSFESEKYGDDAKRVDQLETKLSEFASKPLDYKRNAYTFASNHDKPRMVHCLSMDMKLFHSDLNDKANKDYRKTAYMIMNDKISESLNGDDWNIINNSDDYFKNVSSKAIANGELLRNSIGEVNSKIKYEVCENIKKRAHTQEDFDKADAKYAHIYEALSKAVADVVNGNYYKNGTNKNDSKHAPDSLKKVNEKDGFGGKPIPDAFDIVYDQAVHKYNDGKELMSKKELLEYKNRVDSKATEVGRAKTRIIMRYLGALSGNPTLYAGDELGMTGYEDKCGNTYLYNRNPLDKSIVDEKSENFRKDIYDYRESLFDIFRPRKNDGMNIMEALNNGTMYKLNRQHGTNGKDCSAIIYQAGNGVMNISLLNPNGISSDPKVPVECIKPADITLDKIKLESSKGEVSLTPGTKFRNVNPNDECVYEVFKDNDGYFIRTDLGGQVQMNEKTAPDGVMMLYHIPKEIEKERMDMQAAKSSKEYYNPIYNIPQSNAYQNSQDSVNGKNIDVTSKD